MEGKYVKIKEQNLIKQLKKKNPQAIDYIIDQYGGLIKTVLLKIFMIRKTIGKSVSMIVCWRFGIIQKDLIRTKEISKLFCVPLQNTKRLIFFERN